MKKKPIKVYFALLTDMVHSKEVMDRAEFGLQLERILQDLRERHAGAFYAPPVQSKGIDELSAILQDAGAIPGIILELAVQIHPRILRFAVAAGEISPLSKVATKADGEAFHEAARLIGLAEKKRRLFKVGFPGAPAPGMVEMLMHQALTHIGAWPTATAIAAREKWMNPGLKNEDLAKILKVTPQAISKKLRRSRLDELQETQRLLEEWFGNLSSAAPA